MDRASATLIQKRAPMLPTDPLTILHPANQSALAVKTGRQNRQLLDGERPDQVQGDGCRLGKEYSNREYTAVGHPARQATSRAPASSSARAEYDATPHANLSRSRQSWRISSACTKSRSSTEDLSIMPIPSFLEHAGQQ